MFSFCAVGQTEVNIKGKVMDLQHRPIPGVIVNNGINFTITDQKGAYICLPILLNAVMSGLPCLLIVMYRLTSLI